MVVEPQSERENGIIELRHRRSWIVLVWMVVFMIDVSHILLMVFYWYRQPFQSDSSTSASIVVGIITAFTLVVTISVWRTPFGYYRENENSLTIIHPLTKREGRYPSNSHAGKLVVDTSRIAFIGPTGYRRILVNQVFVDDDGFIAIHNAISATI